MATPLRFSLREDGIDSNVRMTFHGGLRICLFNVLLHSLVDMSYSPAICVCLPFSWRTIATVAVYFPCTVPALVVCFVIDDEHILKFHQMDFGAIRGGLPVICGGLVRGLEWVPTSNSQVLESLNPTVFQESPKFRV